MRKSATDISLPSVPEAFPEAFAKAWQQKDAGLLASLFTEDADFINVTGIWWRTRSDIQKAHEYGFRVIFPDSNLKVTKKTVRMLNSELAIVHARMRLEGQSDHHSSGAGLRFTIFSFVLTKNANGWICCSAQNTDIKPGKETHIIDEDGVLKSVDYRNIS